MPRVTGVIELPDAGDALRSAIVRVRVEDTSRQDAPAVLLGEQVVDGIPRDWLDRGELGFDVSMQTPQAGASCAVRAHLDVNRDGAVSVGDYVSTGHIPVSRDSDTQALRINVSRVG